MLGSGAVMAGLSISAGTVWLQVGTCTVMAGAGLLVWAAASFRSMLRRRHPVFGVVRLADRRAVRVRFRLDRDMPPGTYRSYRWRRPWRPPTLITGIDVNDIAHDHTLVIGRIQIATQGREPRRASR